MKVGLDFDNTIVSYDAVFHAVALEWGMIPSAIAVNKLAVRDYMKQAGNEERWTEMQGYVYGTRMDRAEMFPGVLDFIKKIKTQGNSVFIISHKTAYPFLGPKYDLHAAASDWIKKNMQECVDEVYFEETKEKKLLRIADLSCDVFIDDLPEIILSPNFPKNTAAFLFDPSRSHPADTNVRIFSSWQAIQQALEHAC